MRHRGCAAIPLAILAFAVACAPPTDAEGRGDGNGPPADSLALAARLIADDLDQPVHLATPPHDPRLFVVEQTGRIRIVRDGAVVERPFLDISDRVRAAGERGLLSVAFHPRYSENGYLYVNYTDRQGHTNVERYTVSSDPDSVDPASALRILLIEQPYANHNGGLVAFGLDGLLYVGMGDGGSAGDPLEAAQDLDSPLGKLLRLDVDGAEPYAVPADNPFAAAAGWRALVWSLGLRNPWRFSWDTETARVYVADVGQNRLEELNAQPADAAPVNYGWDDMEASGCFEPTSGCARDGRVLPVHEYDHDEGCSVTGGHVYRGESMPGLQGHYFYADWCAGFVRSFLVDGAGVATQHREWDVGRTVRITSFGLDAAGELYIVGDGALYRLEPS